MKLTKKLKNGKYAVNKSAVIAALKKAQAKKADASLPGLLPVSQREVESEFAHVRGIRADDLLNTSEE
jgi:hypothetical protein